MEYIGKKFFPTEDQQRYMDEWVIPRLDMQYKNDWKGQHDNKHWSKMAEIIAADILGVERPHEDEDFEERIKSDLGWDVIVTFFDEDGNKRIPKVDVKAQKYWNGYGAVSEFCANKCACDMYFFLHYDDSDGSYTPYGWADAFEVKALPSHKAKYAPKKKAYNLAECYTKL